MSSFKSDLSQEKALSNYLDKIYTLKGIDFERVNDINKQYKGIDIIIHHNSKKYYVDEKAQLHYLNKDLPTFTFELSYLNKDKILKEGWLLDKNKLTQYYFLISGIFLKDNKTELIKAEEVEQLKIISVQKEKLIDYLEKIGLTKTKLLAYDSNFRKKHSYGKNPIPELDEKKTGLIYFTEQLAEKPMNLQLRLKHLINIGIAKEFHQNSSKINI